MKIITKKEAVLLRLKKAVLRQSPIFCPNAETVDEIEGILDAARQFRTERGYDTLTVGLGITGSYPDHPQLQRLALGSDLSPNGTDFIRREDSLELRASIWLDWLSVYANKEHLFPGVEVIPFLDHGWAPSPTDLSLMENEEFQQRMGIIMFDASLLPLEENTEKTRNYVMNAQHRVVVEACPDKILSAAELRGKQSEGNILTDPDSAEKFVRRTGVDLIVPSLGTEHRGIPGESIYYRRPLAQELQRRVGSILSLHGTSSLGDNIGHVALDGIVKVNFYTGMARAASESIRSSWRNLEEEPLKIEIASGSYLHNRRRQKVREVCLHMLPLLQTR